MEESDMAYGIEEVEGIGPAFAQKLSVVKIQTTEDLLRVCSDAKGRKEVAAKTGVSEGQLLKWSNLADLMRVSGIGPQFSELLEAAGVDTIKELRTRNAENLAEKMKEVNTTKNLTNAVPTATVISTWIEKAKGMEPKITH
jgi:predicted flap endonuclease-1-like 5' DNA nuclease